MSEQCYAESRALPEEAKVQTGVMFTCGWPSASSWLFEVLASAGTAAFCLRCVLPMLHLCTPHASLLCYTCCCGLQAAAPSCKPPSPVHAGRIRLLQDTDITALVSQACMYVAACVAAGYGTSMSLLLLPLTWWLAAHASTSLLLALLA
jgi:hypothetical protein